MTTWWDAGWSCRKSISVTTTVNSYILPITVKATSGYDGTPANTIYGNGWCSTNYADIRFVAQPDAGGDVLLNHWIETIGADQAYIWVKLSSSIDALGKIWMYYGNTTAAAVSNPSTTFVNVINSLIGAWNIDEGTGTYAADLSGQGHNGSVSTNSAWVIGKFGNATTYNGTATQAITLGTSLYGQTTVSVCAWMMVPSSLAGVNDRRGVTTGTENTNKWMLGLTRSNTGLTSPDRVVFTNSSASHATAVTNVSVKDDAWHHYVGITKPTESIYRDSVLSTSTVTDSWSFEANAKIGNRGSSYPFKGIIDEVFIFNKNLSTAEISDIYNNYAFATLNYPGYALIKPYSATPPTWGTVYKQEPKALEETFSILDEQSRQNAWQRALSDIIPLTDSYNKGIPYSINDSLTLADTYTSLTQFYRTSSETVTLTDTSEDVKLYERFTGDDNLSIAMYGPNWRAQTFTVGNVGPLESHNITKIMMKFTRVGSIPGDVTISLRDTLSGYPTGADLSVGSVNCDGITTSDTGQWIDIPITPVHLFAGKQYAVCARALTGDASNYVRMRRKNDPASYPGGISYVSTNSGTVWGIDNKDHAFMEWGLPSGVTYPQSLTDTLNLSDTLTKHIRETFSDSITLADILFESKFHTYICADTIALSDTKIFALSRSLTEDIPLTDVRAAVSIFQRTLSDVISSSDVRASSATLPRILQDSASMADTLTEERRYEYFTEDTDVSLEMYGPNWRGQTFTVGTVEDNHTHTLTKVRLKLVRGGTPGNVVVSIRNASGDYPTGANLTSRTINGDGITTSLTGEWVDFPLPSIQLTAGSQYAIIVGVPSGDLSNYLRVRRINSDAYAGGRSVISTNSGDTWGNDGYKDIAFEEWGLQLGYSNSYIFAETLGLIDALTSQRRYIRTLSDTVTDQDTLVRSAAYRKIYTETIGLADAWSYGKYLYCTLSDTIVFTYGDSNLFPFTFPITFSGGVSSELNFRLNKSPFSEVVSLSDIVLTPGHYVAMCSDVISLVDTFSRFSRFTRALADTVYDNDTLTRASRRYRTTSDTVSLTDTTTKRTGKVATDTISLADIRTSLSKFYRTATDTITLSDVLGKGSLLLLTLTDVATMSDQLSRSSRFYRTPSDTITLADTRTSISRYGRILSDTITETDIKTIRLAKIFSESISTSDTRTPRTGKLATDIISITDLVTKSSTYYRAVTDTVHVADILETSVHGATQYIKNLTETLTLSDILNAAYRLNRSLTEVLSLSDTATRNTAYRKILAETAVLSDIFTRLAKFVRTPQETITLTDVWSRGIIQVIFANETLNLSDSLITRSTFIRTADELITLNDTVNRGIRYTRDLTDQLNIADNWERLISYNRTLLQPLTLVDTYSSFIWWISEGGGNAHINLTRIGSTQWIWGFIGLTNMDLDSVVNSDSSLGKIGFINITNQPVGQVQISFS